MALCHRSARPCLFTPLIPLMLTEFLSRKLHKAALALPILAAILVGCAVTLPPAPQSNPADPHAPEAATAPLRPTLLATSRSFVSPAADDREQKAKQMDMSKMKHSANDMGAMKHSMSGTSDIAKPAPASANSYYTCVMHPQIHEDKPGQCPICGMTLIEKTPATEGAKP